MKKRLIIIGVVIVVLIFSGVYHNMKKTEQDQERQKQEQIQQEEKAKAEKEKEEKQKKQAAKDLAAQIVGMDAYEGVQKVKDANVSIRFKAINKAGADWAEVLNQKDRVLREDLDGMRVGEAKVDEKAKDFCILIYPVSQAKWDTDQMKKQLEGRLSETAALGAVKMRGKTECPYGFKLKGPTEAVAIDENTWEISTSCVIKNAYNAKRKSHVRARVTGTTNAPVVEQFELG